MVYYIAWLHKGFIGRLRVSVTAQSGFGGSSGRIRAS